MHRLKYGGQVEVVVTQGDTIYVSEAEERCADLTLNSLDALLKECASRHSSSSLLTSPPPSSPLADDNENENDKDSESAPGSEGGSPVSPGRLASAGAGPPTTAAGSSSSSKAKVQRISKRTPVKTAPAAPPVPPLPNPSSAPPSSSSSSLFFDPLLRPPPSSTQPWACSLMVIVPLRLGISSVNQEYHQVRLPVLSRIR